KPEEFEIDSVYNYLKQGENILAIQVHNNSTSSTDLTAIPFFTLGLTVLPPNPGGISPYLEIKPLELHTNFKIKSSGESIYLFDHSGVLMDSMHVNEMIADISQGRKPDGHDSLIFFADATPGGPNNTEGIIITTGKMPVFSHQAGYYPSAFNLTLSASAGDTIYYTTDGSVPDKNSIMYYNPIVINQSTVIRSRILSGPETGDLVTNSYIIGRNFDMPIVSLSLKPEDLWDYYTGIYVEGPNAEQATPHFGANYWMDWEKPAHIEFFEHDGSPGFELDAGIKIYGKWSRAHPQKSLAVYARNIYGGNQIVYDIFRFIPVTAFKSIVLRNSGNDFLYSNFRDLFHQSLVDDLDIDLVAYRPAVIYLNGDYWGIQNIREKITEHYIASHHENVNKDSIDMLENNLDLIHGSSDHYVAMLEFIRSNDITDDVVYNQLKTMMDVNNFIDYQISEIYINNTDWPGNNIKYWRKISDDGKWRWIMFDTDFGFSLYNANNYTHNTLQFAIVPNDNNEWPNPAWATYLLQRLLQNQQFRISFINCFADNLNTRFQPERVKNQILYFRKKYLNEMPYHIQKWGSSMSGWNGNIENMFTFASYRVDYVRNHIRSQFGISSAHQINLNIEKSGSGKIKINTIAPLDYPWTGTYFHNIPVQLTARPEAGYRFVCWQGSVESDNSSLSVNVLSNLNITAVFEPDGSGLNHIIINEINYNSAPEADAGDWIEIYNGGEEAKDISFWRISDSNTGHVYIIPQNTILGPDSYLVICRDKSLFASQYPSVSNYTGNLSFGF
ncbi:MAG TPA: CotH kinase family protein, partial [Bacteroidales bacterium]|nr:CotH kinase family protein [Bacteroidales bacterium]